MADKAANKGVSTAMGGFKVPSLNLTGKQCK